MLLVCLVFLCSWGITNGRHFDNPVIKDRDNPDPGVVFYNGSYYAVTTSSANDGSFQKYPIYSSKDLQNWDLQGYVINDKNRPVWSSNIDYWAPEIHIVGEGQFRVYFTARDNETKWQSIGAAFATNILGPYHCLDRPLVRDLTQDVLDSTVVHEDDGSIYLLWKGREWVYGAQLTSDGLGFVSDEVNLLIRNDLPWEGGIIEGMWVIKRNGKLYMFYSGSEYCTDKYAVGVARADTVFGSWTKKGDPILKSNDDFKGTGHCSVVKDIDNESYVMVYHAYKAGAVCNGNPRLMLAQSMAWDADGWPYMTD